MSPRYNRGVAKANGETTPQYWRLALALGAATKTNTPMITVNMPGTRISELLHDAQTDTDVYAQWQHMAHSLHNAVREKVGYRRQQNSTWFDEECRKAAIEKNDAYQATLMSAATQAVCQKYR